jgi:hypothetical protein
MSKTRKNGLLEHRILILRKSLGAKEERGAGQSMVEMAMTLPLLIMLVLALIEIGIVLATYIALINAAHEGATFASMYPELGDRTCGATPYPTCVGAFDTKLYGGSTVTTTLTIWNEYYDRVQSEVVMFVGGALREGGLLTFDQLTVDRPVLDPATKSTCSKGTEPLCTITVTVHYNLHTFSSDMSLPGVGRLGLPNYYELKYTYAMPIR